MIKKVLFICGKILMTLVVIVFVILNLNLNEGVLAENNEEVLLEDVYTPGKIPVLEYHGIDKNEARWVRSIDNFKKDLLFLKNNDYYPVKVSDYLENDFSVVPSGKKPVLITFDDGLKNQFNILDDGKIDPDCAVGIMEDFCSENDGFNCSALFFVNVNPFGQKDKVKEKLIFLIENGYDIGNHTYNHVNLAEKVDFEKQIGALNNYVLDNVERSYVIDSLAYPFGGYPKNVVGMERISHGEYENRNYTIDGAFLVGAEPALISDHPQFDALKIPRIQAIDSEWLRHFGREKGFTGKVEEKFKPFVVERDNEISDFGIDEINADRGSSSSSSNKKYWYNINFDVEKINGLVSKIFDNEGYLINVVAQNIDIYELPEGISFEDNNFYYEVKQGDNFEIVVNKLQRMNYAYTKDEMIANIKKANEGKVLGVNTFDDRVGDSIEDAVEDAVDDDNANNDVIFFDESDLKPGQKIIIPGVKLIKLKKVVPDDLRGIYLTAYSVKKRGKWYADKVKENDGNMIVFDVKAGRVAYDSKVDQVNELKDGTIKVYDLEDYVGYLHSKGIYAVGRFVVFKDEHLVDVKPEWALKNKKTGKPWENNEGAVWLDPSNSDYHDYIIKLCKEMAEMGIDEIQFDYVRFPALGNTRNMTYATEKEGKSRDEVITDFVRKVKTELVEYDVKIGVDVFGVVGWSDLDAGIVGQKIEDLGNVADAIYPMVYPSHFGKGYHGHADPANEPYYFVQESTDKFLNLVKRGKDDKKVNLKDVAKIRPWFQGFPLGVNGFGEWYMESQKKAINDIDLNSFVIWSPGNYYDVSWGILGD